MFLLEIPIFSVCIKQPVHNENHPLFLMLSFLLLAALAWTSSFGQFLAPPPINDLDVEQCITDHRFQQDYRHRSEIEEECIKQLLMIPPMYADFDYYY
ncbi:Neuropeptide-Like Protein [Caenorhabditis elegans]|uniref:Neuropeptide-Like Protein n=1 Tax=Caenorhabditis elegans TaxID=6239 RepID=E0AHE0_CAEEL|nr:Neuropeptide-Like Protein [Caenorhabditis elegans]CBW44380.1 Neuropeptide-Like Protein [Caenorhabditis elegans]|eukprot:NP_001251605.1 Uncharacterized protein CELE_F36D1.15 [Caenorhabditis elegans]